MMLARFFRDHEMSWPEICHSVRRNSRISRVGRFFVRYTRSK